jgi:PAS domain S-box-containing protein
LDSGIARIAPELAASARSPFLSALPAGSQQQRLALWVVLASALLFAVAAPFAKLPLGQVWAFIPAYQSALVVNDLVTAILLFGQFAILGSTGLLLLASGYLFTALMAAIHALTFPGLFAPTGLLGAGPQTTAWLYMFWHAGFPVCVIAYTSLDGRRSRARGPDRSSGLAALAAIAMVTAAAAVLTFLATAGASALPPIMQGNHYTPAMITVVSSVWLLSVAALVVLWRRKPHSVLDLWLMVVMCAWLFDIALAAVLNAGRFDLGFYAGRIYGLLAASFVLVVLLLENSRLYAGLVQVRDAERQQTHDALTKQAERLRIVHEIDRAIISEVKPEAIAAAVLQPLRGLLGVPRVVVNLFDYAAGEVEWLAAAGRRQTHVGPGVRYPLAFMGDLNALKRGEPQVVETDKLPAGPERDALLKSGVRYYMAIPMIVRDELIGAVSFGGAQAAFPAEQTAIAQECATQLAIAISHARLFERIRRQAEELEQRVRERTAQLEEAGRALEDLYDHAPCGYHSVDADGKFVRMNATWLSWLGYRREEVVGKLRHPDIMTPASAELFRTRWFPLFRKQGWLNEVEFEYVRKDGSTFPALISGSSIYGEDGKFVMSRSTVTDITQRKRIEAELHELNARLQMANKELESFSYSVSHDLRAPLRAVDGYALMLEEDYAPRLDDEGRRLLGVVRASAAQMGRLIDDLLHFSQVGRRPLNPAPLDMRALVREVAADLGPAFPKTMVEIEDLPPAFGDRALLKHVWMNLVGNALKYSAQRAAPRVEIGGRSEGAEAIYWVRDNGAGFDMRYKDKLFNVFQRLHREDEFEGTGVGLAIVQRVVSRHGGRAWGEGAVGEGARFSFALPQGDQGNGKR